MQEQNSFVNKSKVVCTVVNFIQGVFLRIVLDKIDF